MSSALIPTISTHADFLREFDLQVETEFQLDGRSASWASSSLDGPRIWDEEDETLPLLTRDSSAGSTSPSPTRMAMTVDGKYLVVGADSTVRIYDVESFDHRGELLETHDDVQKLVFMESSPLQKREGKDEYVLVVESGDKSRESSSIQFLHLDVQGQAIRGMTTTALNGYFPSFGGRVCSHLGSKLLYNPTGSTAIRVVAPLDDRGRGSEICVLNGHYENITWASWSPNDKIIATASRDATYRLWDSRTGEQRHLIATNGQNWTGAFFNDAKHVLLAGAGPMRVGVYEVESGELVSWIEDDDLPKKDWVRVIAVQTSRGMVVFKRGRELGVWFPFRGDGKGQTLLKLQTSDNRFFNRRGGIETLQFVDLGRKLIAMGEDRTVFVWDLEKGCKWRFQRPKGRVEDDELGDLVYIKRKGGEWILVPGEGKIRCWKL